MKKLLTAFLAAAFIALIPGNMPASQAAATFNTRRDYSSTLGTSLSATTNPDPSTLGTTNPFDADGKTIASAWTSQAKPALFPLGVKDQSGEVPVRLLFKPSGGSAVTYTVTVWVWSSTASAWAKPYDSGSLSFTGNQSTVVYLPGNNPIFLQLSSISTGTLSIYYDSATAEKY